MRYLVIKKDGTETEVSAEDWRQVPPVHQFYNTVINAGRRVDDVVLSVPMSDVVTIQNLDD